MKKDKFINLFCVWLMGESGLPEFYKNRVSSPGVWQRTEEEKTSALKPFLRNMVLCFYFSGFFSPQLWLPQKVSVSSLFRPKSNWCLTLHHSSVRGTCQSSTRDIFQKLCFISIFANSIWSSVREWRLILLWNTELGKIYQCLVGDLETLSINGW